MATYEKLLTGRWRAKVRKKGYPAQSATFDTKKAAQAWAGEVEAQMTKRRWVDTSAAERTTLGEALERYGNEVTPTKKGAKQEIGRLNRWRRDPLSLRPMADVRSADLAKWRDAQVAVGKAASTIRNDLNLISAVFTHAAREWGTEGLPNPMDAVRRPAVDRPRDRRISGAAEYEALLAAAEADASPWIAAALVLLVETAMRRGELHALRWENVDLDRQVAHLPDTKNGESRDVPLSSRAVDKLRGMPCPLDGRVFGGTPHGLEMAWRRVRKAADAPDLRLHDLRHEAASRLFEKGLHPFEVAAITGHKTLNVLKRYTHLRAEDLAKKLG